MDRPLPWDLRHALLARDALGLIPHERGRALVAGLLDRFERATRPILETLPAGVIHNDWNDHNVLVSPGWPREVIGAVDFGDLVSSAIVCDLAIGMAYAMLGKPDAIAAGRHVVAGYHAARPLSETEVGALFDLVCARLCLSVAMAARQLAAAPSNEYLQISQGQVWPLLEQLDDVSPDWAHYVFRAACGLEPCPRAPRLRAWLDGNRDVFGALVPADRSRALVLDLSAGSLELPSLADLHDAERFTRLLFGRMAAGGAEVGVGRYDEARLAYSSAQFVRQGNDGAEPRTVHVGLDLFMPAGTPVLAPLDGVVHSLQHNGLPLDYGPTIVLEHDPGGDVGPFWTLYGHLSLESLQAIGPGQRVARGDRVGTLGDLDVNGGWPPHLHFQIIADMLGRTGDYPGVAAPGERDVWLSICPDPNLIARIPAALFPDPPPARGAILGARRRLLGRNLSVSYQEPLAIVRGWMQHLYDENGLPYLDAVNNVPHVGHSHPVVAAAERRQAAVLNTNTRYLHPHIVRYAERLLESMPAPLAVCYFVNSGSEANELALRLAHARTRRRGILVIDGAYHGNTGALVEISPYKCEGPGGEGLPAHVRKLMTPDVFRGPFQGAGAGRRYAREAGDRIGELGDRGLSAFIGESLLSCAGQIVLPEGYLTAVYETVRAAGGVCIADEVQTGLGRVGTHMWGFETQGVVPDIVTLGKPIGNGYPLGAVITTEAVAEAFANGMEYFSTFGGNPVACAVGLAVLDVLRDENLQQRALDTGGYLLGRLRDLAGTHAVIGDVRGLGLFIGIELVRDPGTLAPAAEQASYVINRLRDRRILTSTDGPLHNVIKIKPPLQFSRPDADRLADTLDEILREDGARP
jgi:4-aminobutyrate aminotransferase-like enzyme